MKFLDINYVSSSINYTPPPFLIILNSMLSYFSSPSEIKKTFGYFYRVKNVSLFHSYKCVYIYLYILFLELKASCWLME